MAKPTALGVYLFAGGFAVGVEEYFKVLAHLEDGPYGARTVKLNRPRRTIHDDPDSWPLDEYAGVDFVFGNPPCAPWSLAGVSKKWSQRIAAADAEAKWWIDPRVSCVHRLFGVLEATRPKVWAWESVTRAFTQGRDLVDHLTEKALGMGYSVTYWLHNAMDMGIPQVRKRFFMLAHRVELELTEPDLPMVTVRDAIGDFGPDEIGDVIRPLKPETQKVLRNTRPGEGLRNGFNRLHPDKRRWKRDKHGRVRGRPTFSSLRLHWDAPAPTMIGGDHMHHPEETRKLSLNEAKTICSYPLDYEIVGTTENKRDEFKQVAQAVMPGVGRWLARDVRRAVDADVKVRKPTVRTVDHIKPFKRCAYIRALQEKEGA